MPIVHKSKIEKQPPGLKGPILVIRGLEYTYPDGQIALRGVSFLLDALDKVALVGPNGSGKSTLLLNINGLLQGQGEILVAGLPVVDKNLPAIRSRVGLVFPNPDDQLFSPTVYEDVAFGPLYMGLSEEQVHQRVHDALEMVHMGEYADRLSYHLSDGEKKRIALATVLSMQPDLLILDEPTAGLDPRARRHLIELLDELPVSMLVATHDLMMVRDSFPRMIVLDKGNIVIDGATSDILQNKERLAEHGLELS